VRHFAYYSWCHPINSPSTNAYCFQVDRIYTSQFVNDGEHIMPTPFLPICDDVNTGYSLVSDCHSGGLIQNGLILDFADVVLIGGE